MNCTSIYNPGSQNPESGTDNKTQVFFFRGCFTAALPSSFISRILSAKMPLLCLAARLFSFSMITSFWQNAFFIIFVISGRGFFLTPGIYCTKRAKYAFYI